MKPDFDDMQAFLAVIEARSFTAAADRLGRTKSAVSQAVTRLEGDLGTTLLYRSTRSLSLTEEGARFSAHCRDLRDQYDRALADLTGNNADPSGTLTLTAPHALSMPLVVPTIGRLVGLHPNMAVRLLADDSRIDLVESRVDLALRVGTPELRSAKVSKLGMLGESLYASPRCVAANGGPPVEPNELSNWDHIANEWQGVPVKYQTPDGSTIRVKPRIRCNALHEILRLAEMGAGVARLPDITARESIERGRLVRLIEVGTAPVFSMHLFPKRAPAKVRTFVQLLRKQLQADSLAVP